MRPTLISNEVNFDFSNPSNVRWARASEESREDSCPHSIQYFVNDETIARQFSHTLDPLLADWIDVGLSCYLADRLATRGISNARRSEKHWSRTLNVTLPVRLLESWTSEVQYALSQTLNFLTEDVWNFNFVERNSSRRAGESQGFLFPASLGRPPRVALYSGGLDSFAGAAQILHESPNHTYVFVSGTTHGRQQAGQRDQLRQLTAKTSAEICQISIPFGLLRAGADGHQREESSQRTRGFLFLTLGAVSAIAAGTNELLLFENGIGAINLPYDGTQLGTYNSRATHPSTLLRMQRFISILTGREFSIENPFLFSTKAEMCRHEAVQELGEDVGLTFSCDGFPVRAKNRAHCGHCTSCLLRRQSLESAGLSRYDCTGYLNNLSSPNFRGSVGQLQALRVMNWQAHRISAAISCRDPWEALVSEFIELQRLEVDLCRNGKVHSLEVRAKLLRLYSAYVTEWMNFSARRHCDIFRKQIA